MRFALLALMACGELGPTAGDANAQDVTTPDAESTDSCVVDSGPIVVAPTMLGPVCPPCPPTPPENDAQCDAKDIGLECEYGDNDDFRCNAIATCTKAVGRGFPYWSVGVEKPCPLIKGGACPIAQPAESSCCVPSEARCDYGSVYCSCPTMGSPRWECLEISCRGARARLGCPCPKDASCLTCTILSAPACTSPGDGTRSRCPPANEGCLMS